MTDPVGPCGLLSSLPSIADQGWAIIGETLRQNVAGNGTIGIGTVVVTISLCPSSSSPTEPPSQTRWMRPLRTRPQERQGRASKPFMWLAVDAGFHDNF